MNAPQAPVIRKFEHEITVNAPAREVYRLLKDGVRVHLRDAEGRETVEMVRVIDWNPDTPSNNDFLLVSQLWVTGQVYGSWGADDWTASRNERSWPSGP